MGKVQSQNSKSSWLWWFPTYHLSTREVGAGRLELKISLDNAATSCPKNNKQDAAQGASALPEVDTGRKIPSPRPFLVI